MFDTPASSSKTFSGNGTTLIQYGSTNSTSGSQRVFSFSASVVRSRVGISRISSGKACNFANTEIPAGTPLQTVASNSKTVWNEKLSTVTTTDTNTSNLIQLYSNIYCMYIIPSNRTGENPARDTGEPYIDDRTELLGVRFWGQDLH
jgi:putative alpha-1,2-mannosidase